MASLHKDPRGKSPFWYCAFTHPDGKRAFKSTKKINRKEAVEVCRGWQRAVDLAEGRNLTEVQVRKVVSEIYERANGEKIHFTSTRDYLKSWIGSKELTTARGTARRYSDVVTSFLNHLGERATRNLGSVTPRDVESFRDLQIKQGKANKTANMTVKTLRIALNTARRQAVILSNPAEAVDMLPENSASRDTFTREQITELLAVADSEWRGMILVGAYHGLRLMDSARLTWANVDTQRRALCFYPQKDRKNADRKPLEIPLHPDVEDYLLSLPLGSNKPDAPIFPTLSRKKGTGANGLSQTFVRLIEKAGIKREPGIQNVKGQGRQVFALSFHSFRHTAISALANAERGREIIPRIQETP